jgi:hypothetical protein
MYIKDGETLQKAAVSNDDIAEMMLALNNPDR